MTGSEKLPKRSFPLSAGLLLGLGLGGFYGIVLHCPSANDLRQIVVGKIGVSGPCVG